MFLFFMFMYTTKEYRYKITYIKNLNVKYIDLVFDVSDEDHIITKFNKQKKIVWL